MKNPTVTILMSVKNGESTLNAAIQSILNQTFQDFEFLIVNDGSSDGTASILEGLQRADPRIRVISQENQGLTKSLQRGLQEARGTFIFRQDADDLSLPHRIETILPLLEKHPFVLSGWENFSEEKAWRSRSCLALTNLPSKLRDFLLGFVNIAAHGTYAFRKSDALELGGYRSFFYLAQDYDLLLRMKPRGIVVVSEILYRLRIHRNSLSVEKKDKQKLFAAIASLLSWQPQFNATLPLNPETTDLSNLISDLSRPFPFRSIILQTLLSYRYS